MAARLGRMYNGEKAAECAFCNSLIYGISLIGQNAKICLAANLVTGAHLKIGALYTYLRFCEAKSSLFAD